MIGVFFTARLGSTRLPQKHLIEAAGKPFIKWLVERYLIEFKTEILLGEIKMFITTSLDPQNKEFESVFEAEPVTVFYGSDENIPLRHLECAKTQNLKYIVSIDGDDILCSTNAARLVINELKTGQALAHTKGLPLGMNVMGYSTDFLEESLIKNNNLKLETGWGRIFDKQQIKEIILTGLENADKLRMTLDYPEDALFFKETISFIGDKILEINDNDLIETIIKHKWNQLNAGLDEQYWANFNRQKEDE